MRILLHLCKKKKMDALLKIIITIALIWVVCGKHEERK